MAISDVINSLITVGTISPADFATVNYDGSSTVSSLSVDYGNPKTNAPYLNFQFKSDGAGGIEFAQVTKANPSNVTFVEATVVAYDATHVVFNVAGVNWMVASSALPSNPTSFTAITDFGTSGSYTAPPPVCFVQGTRIRTDRGEVMVEDLAEGDQVHVAGDDEAASRRVIWIGYRDVNLAALPDPFEVQPIRIRKDAFAKGMPSRDLLVSPAHGIFTDGVLVPAGLLVNGASILRETRLPKVRYFHVELDQHSVLWSEGLASESYLDTGNRGFFQNSAVVDLNAGYAAVTTPVTREAHSRAPFVCDAETLHPIWERLARRAGTMGLSLPEIETTRDPSLKLAVNGQLFRPASISGGRYSFVLPSGFSEVRLLSHAARPSDTSPWIGDHRLLGVSVNRVRLHQGGDVMELPLDGPAFGRGWWQLEQHDARMVRWTNGEAVLRLPEASAARRVLDVTTGGAMSYPLPSQNVGKIETIARIA